MIDSLSIKPQVPQSVRIEGPIGALEVDSGNNVLDGTIVIVIILALYAGKKIVDKFLK